MENVWPEFTPFESFVGGAMIGAAASELMLLNGQILGMSGILTDLMVRHTDWSWRVSFVVGVILGPFVIVFFGGTYTGRWLSA